MSTPRRAPEADAARLRLRLAGLVLLSVTTVGFVASGAAAQSVDELLGDDATEHPDSTTTGAAETTTSVAPTSTEFLESAPEGTSAPQASPSTRPAITSSELDDDVLDDGTEETGTTSAAGLDRTETTRSHLLVAGDGTDGPQSTTTTSEPRVNVTSDDETFSEETVLWMVVAGLVVVALLIGLWTVRYWRVTRPEPVVDDGPDDATTVFTT